MAKKPAINTRIADNKKAAYNYFFEERFEAGLVLEGWEVKSLREGKVQLTDGYVVVRGWKFGNSPKDSMMLIMAISVSCFNAWLAFIRGRVKVIQKRLYFPAQ